MKFICLLIGLILSVSSYSKLLKRSISLTEESFLNSLSPECREEYENSEYYKCTPKQFDISTLRSKCSDINTNECQTFYEDPLKYYPVCKNFPEFTELFEPNIFRTLLQGYDVYCQTDENDEPCPYSLYLINRSSENILNEQCKSKKCTESLLNVYKNLKFDQYASLESSSYTSGNFNSQDMNIKSKMVSALESDECKTAHATSGTNPIDIIKINNILLIILLLLFIN